MDHDDEPIEPMTLEDELADRMDALDRAVRVEHRASVEAERRAADRGGRTE